MSFEEPGKPQSTRLDSMSNTRKDGSVDVNYGVQLRMLVRLVQFNNPKKATLEWSFGPGYRNLRNSPASYSNGGARFWILLKTSFLKRKALD
jgi:hypothetical protein